MKTFIVILALALTACGDGCDPEASVAPVMPAPEASVAPVLPAPVVSPTADSATKEVK